MTLTLPLPAKELYPNARPHYMAKARAVKAARKYAWGVALGELSRFKDEHRSERMFWEKAVTQARFFFAVNRRRDEDGLASALKAYWDGIADAGVVVNDSAFTHMPPIVAIDKANPRVELTVTPV